jgi:hypothetical protein
MAAMFAMFAAAADRVVLDLDFTKGRPSDDRLKVGGGQWKSGWKVTGDTDRILIDIGRKIANGYVEVTVTREGDLTFAERKRNWLGVFAEPSGHQNPGGYARTGAELYGFSKAEIFAAGQPNTICEKVFGKPADWLMDGMTPRIVKAEVASNVMTWSHDGGASASCGSDAKPVTHFRYIMLGGVLDHKLGWHHGSLVGLKVLSVRVVDRGSR